VRVSMNSDIRCASLFIEAHIVYSVRVTIHRGAHRFSPVDKNTGDE